MRKLLFILLGATIIAAAYAETGLAETSATLEDALFRGIPGVAMDDAELAGYLGGDVYMELSEKRNRIKVTVTSTDPEAKLGLIPKREVFYVDAHNRVVTTTAAAPYFATAAEKKRLGNTSDMRSTPEPFPVGAWNITSVGIRSDEYGPNIIRTDAVGKVNVYDTTGKDFYGRYDDTGYAIHSNVKPFSESKSWGCVIVRQADNERIAQAIREDRQAGGRIQRFIVRGGFDAEGDTIRGVRSRKDAAPRGVRSRKDAAPVRR